MYHTDPALENDDLAADVDQDHNDDDYDDYDHEMDYDGLENEDWDREQEERWIFEDKLDMYRNEY